MNNQGITEEEAEDNSEGDSQQITDPNQPRTDSDTDNDNNNNNNNPNHTNNSTKIKIEARAYNPQAFQFALDEHFMVFILTQVSQFSIIDNLENKHYRNTSFD